MRLVFTLYARSEALGAGNCSHVSYIVRGVRRSTVDFRDMALNVIASDVPLVHRPYRRRWTLSVAAVFWSIGEALERR